MVSRGRKGPSAGTDAIAISATRLWCCSCDPPVPPDTLPRFGYVTTSSAFLSVQRSARFLGPAPSAAVEVTANEQNASRVWGLRSPFSGCVIEGLRPQGYQSVFDQVFFAEKCFGPCLLGMAGACRSWSNQGSMSGFPRALGGTMCLLARFLSLIPTCHSTSCPAPRCDPFRCDQGLEKYFPPLQPSWGSPPTRPFQRHCPPTVFAPDFPSTTAFRCRTRASEQQKAHTAWFGGRVTVWKGFVPRAPRVVTGLA